MSIQAESFESSPALSNRVPSFTGLKPLILAKISSESTSSQRSQGRRTKAGVLGYGGGLGLTSTNTTPQRRSTSARQSNIQQSRGHMIISYQLSPTSDEGLSLGFSPRSIELNITSPNARNHRSRSETFKFPLPPSNLDGRIFSFINPSVESEQSSPEFDHLNQGIFNSKSNSRIHSQSWKSDAQSWINERSSANFEELKLGGLDWSDAGEEKERLRLHLEAQAQLGGRQGWSPETASPCSPTFPSQTVGLGFEEEEKFVTAPLSFIKKPASLEHRDSQDTTTASIRSWAFSTAAASSISSSGRVSAGPPSYSSNQGSDNEAEPSKEVRVAHVRRTSTSNLPPAYGDEEADSDGESEEEPQEYPFPIMDGDLSFNQLSEQGDVEDEEKLRRLNESFLLLGQENDEDVQLPNEGLGSLPAFINPFTLDFDSNREFTAPSLAEQMAYACGSGMNYLSADEEEQLGWEARGLRREFRQKKEAEDGEEEQSIYGYDEERAEIGSSWSAHGEVVQDWDQVETEDELYWKSSQSPEEMSKSERSNASSGASTNGHYRLDQGLGRAGSLRRAPTTANIRTLSILSGSSTSSSPILSGVLAAPRPRAATYSYEGERSPVDIDSLFGKPLSLEIEQGEIFVEKSQAQEEGDEEQDGLFNDFAYLLDDSISDFKVPEPLGLSASKTVPADLNMIVQPSPALTTPSLGLDGTPEMFSDFPSPLARSGRKIDGLPSLSSCPAFPFQSPQEASPLVDEAVLGLPSPSSTSSNLSILDRPRPFGRTDSGVEYLQIKKKVKRPTSSLSQNTFASPSSSSSSSRLMPSSCSPEIPIRRSSFEERKEVVVEASIAKTQTSPATYFEESRKSLVDEALKAKIMSTIEQETRKAQVQIQIRAPAPSVSTSSSSKGNSSSSRKGGLLRNKLSVAALKGLVSLESKKPSSVAMKPSSSSSSSSSGRSTSTSVSKPKSILSASSSSSRLSASSQPVIKGSELEAIRRSCADKAAFIKAAAAAKASGARSNYAESVHSSSSSGSLPSTTSSRPFLQSKLTTSSRSSQTSISSYHSLPTLCVARTPSQRKRGETGLPETSSSQLASLHLAGSDEISNKHLATAKKNLNVDGKGVTIGLARTESGRIREVKVENGKRLPQAVKDFKQARRVSQVKALVHGSFGEDRGTLPMKLPESGVLVLEEKTKDVVQVMVKF